MQTLELELKQLREETGETTKALMKKNAKLTSELRSSMLPPPHPGRTSTEESAAQSRKDSRADESTAEKARLRSELMEAQEEQKRTAEELRHCQQELGRAIVDKEELEDEYEERVRELE